MNTGPIRFTVRKKGFALFDTVSVIAYGMELPVCGPLACGNGFTIETAEGKTFDTLTHLNSTVRVEEAGPLRVTLLTEGRHESPEVPASFSYQTRIYAAVGRSGTLSSWHEQNTRPTFPVAP